MLVILTLQAVGEMSGEDGLGSQSYVPFSLPKDQDIPEDTTKYVLAVPFADFLHWFLSFGFTSNWLINDADVCLDISKLLIIVELFC